MTKSKRREFVGYTSPHGIESKGWIEESGNYFIAIPTIVMNPVGRFTTKVRITIEELPEQGDEKQ